jgi:hypothetical protein
MQQTIWMDVFQCLFAEMHMDVHGYSEKTGNFKQRLIRESYVHINVLNLLVFNDRYRRGSLTSLSSNLKTGACRWWAWSGHHTVGRFIARFYKKFYRCTRICVLEIESPKTAAARSKLQNIFAAQTLGSCCYYISSSWCINISLIHLLPSIKQHMFYFKISLIIAIKIDKISLKKYFLLKCCNMFRPYEAIIRQLLFDRNHCSAWAPRQYIYVPPLHVVIIQ